MNNNQDKPRFVTAGSPEDIVRQSSVKNCVIAFANDNGKVSYLYFDEGYENWHTDLFHAERFTHSEAVKKMEEILKEPGQQLGDTLYPSTTVHRAMELSNKQPRGSGNLRVEMITVHFLGASRRITAAIERVDTRSDAQKQLHEQTRDALFKEDASNTLLENSPLPGYLIENLGGYGYVSLLNITQMGIDALSTANWLSDSDYRLLSRWVSKETNKIHERIKIAADNLVQRMERDANK